MSSYHSRSLGQHNSVSISSKKKRHNVIWQQIRDAVIVSERGGEREIRGTYQTEENTNGDSVKNKYAVKKSRR